MPFAYFPQMFTNGHWGKWTFEKKGHPKCPVPISPKFFQMGSGENFPSAHLKKFGVNGRRALVIPR